VWARLNEEQRNILLKAIETTDINTVRNILRYGKTYKELLDIARRKGITNYSRMCKGELIEALRNG